MGDPIKNYSFGVDGVNIVSDPLKLKDSEATQLQNAELLADEATGGKFALKMRGGLAALNSSALAGSVLGMFGWPLRTTVTKTVYAARQTESANTFRTSTDGSTWANSATAAAPVAEAKYADESNQRAARRAATFRSFIVYPGDTYTQDTDDPILVFFDGTNSVTALAVKYGPSGNTAPPFVITDILVANGTIYLAVHEPGGSGANVAGRVLSLDIDTGRVKQIANSFGNGTGEVTGGAPNCLAFYQNQLWVGLNSNSTTDANGKIVRCYPGIDTTWTTDVSNLRQSISSLMPFKGNLYAGTYSSTSAGATITERTATAGTWTTRATSGGGAGGTGHYASLTVYGGALYAVEYHSTTPIIHIVTSTDGSSWSTSRDVDSVDGGVAGNLPGGMCDDGNIDDQLFVVFRSTTAGGTDGFIMRFAGGTWTKIDTGNFGGPIAVLIRRSA